MKSRAGAGAAVEAITVVVGHVVEPLFVDVGARCRSLRNN
jgi:hypothetical protein